MTVVTDIACSKEDALSLVQTTGNQLDRFIRRRFNDAVWLMFPEVNVKLARDIADGLVVHRDWRRGLSGDRLVYKVHFHGMIYTPGMSSRDLEQAFRFGRSGKRFRHFSGHNQVRAIDMRENLESGPDVEGVSGYATKNHFKPPVASRMLEGAAEWVWLTYQILSDSRLVKIGGVNGPHNNASSVKSSSNNNSDSSMSSVSNRDSIGHSSVNDGRNLTDKISIDSSSSYLGSYNSLNCTLSNSSKHSHFSTQVKKNPITCPKTVWVAKAGEIWAPSRCAVSFITHLEVKNELAMDRITQKDPLLDLLSINIVEE